MYKVMRMNCIFIYSIDVASDKYIGQ